MLKKKLEHSDLAGEFIERRSPCSHRSCRTRDSLIRDPTGPGKLLILFYKFVKNIDFRLLTSRVR